MPLLLQRQLPVPSGLTTIPAVASGTALNTDSVDTGTLSGLSPPTFTFTSIESQTPSIVSTVPSFSPVADSGSGGGGSSSINTPTIIGLIVGIFLLLAATLIVFMTIRHRKRRQNNMQTRTLSSARKSWSRLKGDTREPPAAQMQMRSTSVAKTAPAATDTSSPTGHGPFLSHIPTDPIVWNDPSTSSHGNSTQQQPSGSGRSDTHNQAFQSELHGTHESHIPNPFKSPPTSRSPSRSPSTHSTNAPSVSSTTDSNFVQHLPQYPYSHSHNTSMLTASSISAYPDELPAPINEFSPHPKPEMISEKFPESVHVSGKRTRELKAMQDLISALDERAQNAKEAAGPSSFNLSIDTHTTWGSSRLSMGEGLVTPGGHSLRKEDVVMKNTHGANPYSTNVHKSTDDEQRHFPLQPMNVSRATFNPGEGQEKSDQLQKGKGRRIAQL